MNYQPFSYPYTPYMTQAMPAMAPQPPSPPVQADDRIYVSGEQEAASWVVLRGQSVRLWDRNGQTFYVKTVSESGQPLPLEIYDYRKRGEAPKPDPVVFNPDDYVRHDEFEEFKRQMTRKKKKEEVIVDAGTE